MENIDLSVISEIIQYIALAIISGKKLKRKA